MPAILGVLAGIALPIQTSMNTRLRKKVKSPYNAALISFIVSFVFLILLLIVTGQGLKIPFEKINKEPFWIWCGGIFGVIFLTGNILLLSKVGSIQTVVLPVLGQIFMSMIIDTLGLFHAEKTELGILKIIGAILVVFGVIIVVRPAKKDSTDEKKENRRVIGWQIFGVIAGMFSSTQTAINGRMGKLLESPIKASAISFAVGILVLIIVCVATRNRFRDNSSENSDKNPFWMWFGGIFGGLYILTNVFLSQRVGIGLTVILLLIGSTIGGMIIDEFGLLDTEKKKITIQKIGGVIIMIIGAALIKMM